MAVGGMSPKSKQRTRLLETYRGRGHRNNNLWLVYSVKTRRDWILTSDRKLIHWIRYLETDPNVARFELHTPGSSSAGVSDGDEHYADAWLRNGSRERHLITSGRPERQLVLGLPSSALEESAPCRIFNDAELAPHAAVTTRWLKAIAYASAIRDQEHAHVRTALAVTFNSRQQGTIKDLLDDVKSLDPPVAIGVLVRAAILGAIDLDLSDRPLCMHTWWRVREGHHVVT